MGFSWAQKNHTHIGIDFGSDSIKLLQVGGEDAPQLIAAAAIELPEEARADAETYRKFVSQSLRSLIREGKFKGKRVVASISAFHTFVQHVRIAKGEPALLGPQIETELRGRLPIDPISLVIRHAIVGDVFADGAAKQEVICFAASRDSVMRTVNTVRQAGLDVVGMHCEPMAILESFAHIFRRANDGDRTTFFLDIGGATTKAMIAHGKKLVFCKTIHVGGAHFIRQYAAAAKITPAEARTRRIVEASRGSDPSAPPPAPRPGLVANDRRGATLPVGVAALGDGAAAPQPDRSQPAAAPAVLHDESETLDCLVDELQLCLGYHGSMFQGRVVEKLIFLGGEARQTSMCQKIAQALRLPAQVGDPLARVQRNDSSAKPFGVDFRQPQPGWAVPLGLCLLPTNL